MTCLAYTCCTRSCRICMLCSILTCMYRIYSRKKKSEFMVPTAFTKESTWRTRPSKISVTTIGLSSSAIHFQPPLRRQKASRQRGVVGQQRFRKQIMPFILSMLVFGELIVAHSKLHPNKIPSQIYEMMEHVIQLQRWAWTHGLHCPPRCGFDIGASLAIEAARSLAKDWCCWDGLWRWRVK